MPEAGSGGLGSALTRVPPAQQTNDPNFQAGNDPSAIDAEFQQWLEQNFPEIDSRGGGIQSASREQIGQYWQQLNAAQKATVFQTLKATKSVPAAQAAIAKIVATPPAAQSTPWLGAPQAGSDYPNTPQFQQELQGYNSPDLYGPSGTSGAMTYMLNGVSNTDPTAIAQALGLDPHMLQQQYQSYQAGMQNAQQRRMGGIQSGQTSPSPETLQNFAMSMATVQQGQWMPAINAIGFWWKQQTGNPLPPALAAQLSGAFNNLTKPQQNTLSHQMIEMAYSITQGEAGTGVGEGKTFDPTSLITGFLTNLQTEAPSIYSGSLSEPAGGQGSVISNYATANPNQTATIAAQKGTEIADTIQQLTAAGMPANEITTSLINTVINSGLSGSGTSSALTTYLAFMQEHKITPTASLITQLLSEPFFDPSSGAAPPGSGGSTLLTMPSPVKGLNLGGYISSYNSLQTLWTQYFGTGKVPSNSQIAWGVGKSQQQILDYINNSPSSVAGVNIGRYNDIANLIQNFNAPSGSGSTNSFSSVVDDSIVNSLHQAITQKPKAPVDQTK